MTTLATARAARETTATMPVRTAPRLRVVETAGTHEAAAAMPAVGTKHEGNLLRAVAIALAAPFIGLAGILCLPVIGLAVMVRYAAVALFERRARLARFVKNVLLFLAAPVVGLAYAAAFPFVAFGMLALAGGKALRRRN